MIILTFYYSGDHFRSFFPILSVEALNFAEQGEEKLHSKKSKYLVKM